MTYRTSIRRRIDAAAARCDGESPWSSPAAVSPAEETAGSATGRPWARTSAIFYQRLNEALRGSLVKNLEGLPRSVRSELSQLGIHGRPQHEVEGLQLSFRGNRRQPAKVLASVCEIEATV